MSFLTRPVASRPGFYFASRAPTHNCVGLVPHCLVYIKAFICIASSFPGRAELVRRQSSCVSSPNVLCAGIVSRFVPFLPGPLTGVRRSVLVSFRSTCPWFEVERVDEVVHAPVPDIGFVHTIYYTFWGGWVCTHDYYTLWGRLDYYTLPLG